MDNNSASSSQDSEQRRIIILKEDIAIPEQEQHKMIELKVNEKIRIQNGEWKQKQVSSLMKYIQKWDGCEIQGKIIMVSSQSRQVKSSLTSQPYWHYRIIKFCHCRYLIEYGCRIYNHQGQVVIHLSKERNKICSLRNMRKIQTLKLKQLGIAGNFITDCQVILQFRSAIMSMIAIETYESVEQSADLRWVNKLNTQKLTDIYIMFPKKIKNSIEKILNITKNKHKALQILFDKPDVNLQIDQ